MQSPSRDSRLLLARRLASNGLLPVVTGPLADPLAAVEQTVGIQAQVQLQAELNLALRAPTTDPAQLDDLYRRRSIVKSWGQRWTLHLYSRADWELIVNARSGERINNVWFKEHPTDSHRGAERLAQELADRPHHRLTQAEIRQVLAERFPDLSPIPSLFCYVAAMALTAQGTAYLEPARAHNAQSSWTLVQAADFCPIPAQTAVAALIPRFVNGHGPVSCDDFIKWLGVKASTVRPVWRAVVGDGQCTLDTDAERDARLLAALDGQTIIAARFDSLLTAYKDKSWLVPPERSADMCNGNGTLMAPVIYDGRLAGRWSHTVTGTAVSFQVKAWGALDRDQLEDRFQLVAAWLGGQVKDIDISIIS